MASALANLFLGEDHTVESSILDELHRRFPLNRRAATISPFDYEDSERIRLRRALQALTEEGIRTEGVEPSQSQSQWHVRLVGNLAREGHLKNGLKVRVTEREDYPMPLESILQTTQMILQGQGFPVIINRKDEVIIPRHEVTEDRLPWVELALSEPVEGMTAQEAERWVAASSRFEYSHDIESWHKSGFTLEQAQEWMSKTTKDDNGETRFVWSGPSQVAEWAAAGYDVETATQWAEVGYRMSYLSYAKSWIDNGIGPREAGIWLALVGDGYNGGFGAAEKLKKAGINQTMARRLKQLGFTRKSHEILHTIERGMSAKQFMEWAEIGADNFSIHQVESWQSRGFSAEVIAEWFKMSREFNCSRSYSYWSRFEEWIEAGLGVEDARPWVEIDPRFINYQVVQGWASLGLTPADAKPWLAISPANGRHYADLSYVMNVMEWQDIHPCFCNPANVAMMLELEITPNKAKAVIDILPLAR